MENEPSVAALLWRLFMLLAVAVSIVGFLVTESLRVGMWSVLMYQALIFTYICDDKP